MLEFTSAVSIYYVRSYVQTVAEVTLWNHEYANLATSIVFKSSKENIASKVNDVIVSKQELDFLLPFSFLSLCTYSLGLYLFGKSKLAQKLLVKCW